MAQTINLDTSQRVDIICRKGDTFSLRLTLTDEAGETAGFISGDTFLMQVRDSDTAAGVISNSQSDAEFEISVTANATDVTNKYVDFSKDASIMKTMPAGEYVYDIEQTSGSVTKTLIYGVIKINEDITEA